MSRLRLVKACSACGSRFPSVVRCGHARSPRRRRRSRASRGRRQACDLGRRAGDARRPRPPRRPQPARAVRDLAGARHREEHAPPDLHRPRRARLGGTRRGRPLRPRDPGAAPGLDLVRAPDRHGLPHGRRRVPHRARRDDRARRSRRRRVALHRARGDVAAGTPRDARRVEDAGVRLGERPRRARLASRRQRWRPRSVGGCSSPRPGGG